jgi:hypothetical protein
MKPTGNNSRPNSFFLKYALILLAETALVTKRLQIFRSLGIKKEKNMRSYRYELRKAYRETLTKRKKYRETSG